ncbi:pyridoxamine 5'-phosphate oxidase family protein [Neiella marina]|uniref:Pyridoxamine 5'-phosphate oxidase family protein n=1 Tax=Neiella holothuriorum TaxID=2870530 RepID=A0ABS7EGW2_9GAMM|nr:pyridoxamine 5'-phosphate oxidase family protein [Neiella holothuriorum]MBW8191584.1 pyridoxamine 5'-phosphate oxidase family protein [Neiella holothuriorum]
MSSERIAGRVGPEIKALLDSRKSLFLASTTEEGTPYASYAPFAIDNECFYVLLSEIAVHAINLQLNPFASVLVVEDEDSADQLFARLRVSYQVQAKLIDNNDNAWQAGIDVLANRHGELITNLSQLGDFKLFRLEPQSGRFVKGFGRAFSFTGAGLLGEEIAHMRDGHKKREESAQA